MKTKDDAKTAGQAPRWAEVLTKDEAAEYLRCSPATVQRWTQQGLLRPYRVGQRPRYPRAMLERFIADGGRHDPTPADKVVERPRKGKEEGHQ